MTLGSPCLCRDVAWLGDCDSGCLALAELLGWKVPPKTFPRPQMLGVPCPPNPSGTPLNPRVFPSGGA